MSHLLVPKVNGGDVEIGNAILGLDRATGTGREASRALLREVDGLSRRGASISYRSEANNGLGGWLPGKWGRKSQLCLPAGSDGEVAKTDDDATHWSDTAYDSSGCSTSGCSASDYGTYGYGYTSYSGYDPQDWGRKFLPANGGCIYVDLDHLELCLPEVLSAWDHVAAWHAMLRIARGVSERANEGLPDGQRLQVLIANSDRLGHSYGSHLDFLISRQAWKNLFHRKLHQLLVLASYQVSSIVFTGQGKVGAESRGGRCDFQLTQRGDFFETLVGSQTTYNRPLVNSRDEALCGSRSRGLNEDRPADDLSRLHVIFYDSNLCHTANLLKVGCLQIVLSMIEAEEVRPELILDDPLRALHVWGRDPSLQARARLSSKGELTAVEWQLRFLEDARRFVDSGRCEGVVPRASEIIELWADTLCKLEKGDFDNLSRRLDWVLKRSILERSMESRPHLDWDSPELQILDLQYANLDPEEGLYWVYENAGQVDRVVSEEAIEAFVNGPPEDTRAWARAMFLRRAGRDDLLEADWDRLRFRIPGPGFGSRSIEVDFSDPLAWTRQEAEALFASGLDLGELLAELCLANETEREADTEQQHNQRR